MSWKSLAWNALSQAQKSIDTVLSNANSQAGDGYSDLDPFSNDLSGFVGTTLYTSSPLPPNEPPQTESDESPLPSDQSDTEECSLNNGECIDGESDTNQGLSDSNQASDSTEFKEVDLFSVPSREDDSLLDTADQLTMDSQLILNGSVEQEDTAPVLTESTLLPLQAISVADDNSETPGIIDNEDKSVSPEPSSPQSPEPVESHSLAELQEMLRVREAKLFELHESYALLHDSYELLRDNARAEVDQLIAEKDEKIQRLFHEGEQLSKKEVQQNKHIKKLKNNIKDLEYKNKVATGRLSDTEKVNSNLRDEKSSLETLYKKEQETNKSLESMNNQQEKELLVLKREQSNLLIKIEEFTEMNNINNSELNSLKQSTMTTEMSTENAIKSAEDSYLQQKRQALADQDTAFMLERRSFQDKVNELQQTLVWKEQTASRLEERLKEEIEELRAQVERGEHRAQQFSQSVSSSTQPLLREIEHLRSSQSDQSQNWAGIESNLRSDISLSHQENARLREDIHLVQDEKQMFEIRLASVDKKLSSHREEQQQSFQQLEFLRAELAKSKLETQDQEARFRLWRDSYQGSIDQLREENRRLQADLLEIEREYSLASAYNKPFLSSLDISAHQKNAEQEEIALNRTHSSASLSDADQYSDTGAASLWSSATQVDRLQQLLRQKEGQTASYKQQTTRLEKSCALLTDELALLTASNQELSNRLEQVPVLRKQLMQLSKRHDATLEMCGEKIEETEELKMDIKDVKEMYKLQTEELVTLLEQRRTIQS